LTDVRTYLGLTGAGVSGVINIDFLSVIRRWRFRQKTVLRKIERRSGWSRNTIREHLHADTVEAQFKVPDGPSNLDPSAEKLSG